MKAIQKKQKKDSFVAAVGRALQRSAKVARKTARFHGTPIYIWRNGKVVAEGRILTLLPIMGLGIGDRFERPSRSRGKSHVLFPFSESVEGDGERDLGRGARMDAPAA